MQFAALLPTQDKLGRLFDPARFKPKLDALGRWVNARAGRKPAKKTRQLALSMSSDPTATAPATETPAPASGEAAPATSAAETTPPAAADAAPKFDDIETAAGPAAPAPGAAKPGESSGEGEDGGGGNSTAETVIGIIQTALVLIGDDEGVLSAQEKRMLRPPLERVLKKYDVGADVLPAEVDLALAMATIIIVRLKKPKTATWFAKVRIWFGGRVAEAKGRALAASVKEANS